MSLGFGEVESSESEGLGDLGLRNCKKIFKWNGLSDSLRLCLLTFD